MIQVKDPCCSHLSLPPILLNVFSTFSKFPAIYFSASWFIKCYETVSEAELSKHPAL